MSKKKDKANKKVDSKKLRKSRGVPVIKRGVPQPGITKEEFMDVLAKAARPAEPETQPDEEKPET
jgi:hypothetical protein